MRSGELTVDAGLCTGSGICADLAPDVLVLKGETAETPPQAIALTDAVVSAVDSCPMGAITVQPVDDQDGNGEGPGGDGPADD